MAGKIVRPKNRNNTVRAMPKHGGVVGLRGHARAGAFLMCANGNVDLADHGGDFGGGFPQWLAGFESDGVCK